MKHKSEWVAQPEMSNKYLLVNIMEGTLMTTRYSFLLPNPSTASKRWHQCGPDPVPMEDFIALSEPGGPGYAPFSTMLPTWIPCAVAAFQSSLFPRKGIFFLLTSMQTERELRRQVKTTQQEDLNSVQGRVVERRKKKFVQTILCQFYNFPLIHMWICVSTHVL